MNFDLDKPLNKILNKLEAWVDALIVMLPNMVMAILIFVVFIMLAKFGKMIFTKTFSKASNNKALENLFSTVFYYLILGLGIFIILGILKLDKAVTSLLAGVGVIGLALGFAFQDIAANFVSGVILAFRHPFRRGEIVEIDGIMGTVSRTNLRVTIVRTFQGQEVFIPNKNVLQNKIVNYSNTGKRRIDLAVGVSYAEDLEHVEKIVRDCIKDIEGVIDHDKTIFDYYEFGGSSINFKIRFWIEYPDAPSYLNVTKRAIIAIKKAFDSEGISIPFPIRTLDFGIKGGEKLSEMKLAIGERSASTSNESGED